MNQDHVKTLIEIRCELVDLTREILEACDKPVKWLITFPNMVSTACEEHYQFFKDEARRTGFEKVVEYEPFEIDSYHEKLKRMPTENYLNSEE